MAINTDVDESNSNTSFAGNEERKPTDSKTSIHKASSEKLDEASDPKKTTSQACKKNLKAGGSKPNEPDNSSDNSTPILVTIEITEDKQSVEKLEKTQSETCLENKIPEKEENQKSVKPVPIEEQSPKTTPTESSNANVDVDAPKKIPVATNASETATPGAPVPKTAAGNTKIARHRTDAHYKRPSEIPKLKSLSKASHGAHQKPSTFNSKLPVKTVEKEFDQKHGGDTLEGIKNKTDSLKAMVKSYKTKKEPKQNDKVKQAMTVDFSYLVPLYEREFKKISDVWVNTIYCSLTMRTNLVKLLFQAFPNINRAQFHTEDERLLHCIAHAKSCTKLEAESLMKFVRNLVANREKTKEDYGVMIANKEIADCYNHDWRKLIRKVTDLGEEAKLLQIETPELQKKKEANEINMNEKIRRMEMNLCKKEDEIKKLVNQLNVLKQKESAYKENVLLKIPDYKEIKADVNSLISTQKEFDELKAKYLFQNYTYEKKIKDLENLLEDKRKVLEKEKDVKKQLQGLLVQLQAHKKRLTTTVGREQVDYVMGRSLHDRGKRREQLWIASVKLVLRGFLIQMKKLERDRNKMLLELQANDLENATDLASIIQKDNFIKSIRQQMYDLQKLCNCPNVRSSHV